MKYIIKNCPNYLPEFFYLGACKCEKGSSINGKYMDNCKDISDCLLKQIAGECKEEIEILPEIQRGDLAERIFSLLEIEEINEW